MQRISLMPPQNVELDKLSQTNLISNSECLFSSLLVRYRARSILLQGSTILSHGGSLAIKTLKAGAKCCSGHPSNVTRPSLLLLHVSLCCGCLPAVLFLLSIKYVLFILTSCFYLCLFVPLFLSIFYLSLWFSVQINFWLTFNFYRPREFWKGICKKSMFWMNSQKLHLPSWWLDVWTFSLKFCIIESWIYWK